MLQRLPAYYKIQPTEWEIYIKPQIMFNLIYTSL